MPNTFAGLVNLIIDIITVTISAIFGLLFIYVMWKLIDAWILNAHDETKRSEGRRFALLAVVIVAVMVTVWGIVAIIQTSLFPTTP